MIVLEGQTGKSLECFLYSFIVPELCLLADVQGGFEVDAPVKVKQAVPVGASPGKTSSKLQKGTNNIGLTGMCLLIISEPLDISERQRECLPVLNTHYCNGEDLYCSGYFQGLHNLSLFHSCRS